MHSAAILEIVFGRARWSGYILFYKQMIGLWRNPWTCFLVGKPSENEQDQCFCPWQLCISESSYAAGVWTAQKCPSQTCHGLAIYEPGQWQACHPAVQRSQSPLPSWLCPSQPVLPPIPRNLSFLASQASGSSPAYKCQVKPHLLESRQPYCIQESRQP